MREPKRHVDAASARPKSEINRRQRRVLKCRDQILFVLASMMGRLDRRSRDELLQELYEDIVLRLDDPDSYYGAPRSS